MELAPPARRELDMRTWLGNVPLPDAAEREAERGAVSPRAEAGDDGGPRGTGSAAHEMGEREGCAY